MLYRLACGLLFASLPLLMLVWPSQAYADIVEIDSYWMQQPSDWSPSIQSRQQSQPQIVSQTGISLKGGHHWHVIDLSFDETTRQVIDFRNSSVIANLNIGSLIAAAVS